MTSEPMVDHGQTLTAPTGNVIGFLDGKAEFEGFAEDLQDAGYPATEITSLYGQDGIQLLERLKDHRLSSETRSTVSFNSASKNSGKDITPLRLKRVIMDKLSKS